jgi:hypothetical protein
MNREALDDDLLDIPFPRSDERLSRTDALFSTPWDDLELVTGSAGQQNEARPHWDQFLGSEHYIYEDSEFSSIAWLVTRSTLARCRPGAIFRKCVEQSGQLIAK